MHALAQTQILLGRAEFDYFRTKIFELAGISLSDVKKDLVQTRLRSRLMVLDLLSYQDYYHFLSSIPTDHPEWEIFVNVLTTNKTDWFREPEHFYFIVKNFLPKWKTLGKNHLKIWCAASSTGEEPYTLSMVLHKALKDSQITFSILATDIDTKVLGIAQNGVFATERIVQVPAEYQNYFSMGTGAIENWMKLKPEIKKNVTFKQFNLVNSHYGNVEDYDLIMCRNVLIYFKSQTIQQVVESLYSRGKSDSVFLISHSESLQNIKTSWKYMKPSIYIKGKLF